MTNRLSQTVAAGLVVLAAFGMVQWAWVGHQSLFGLFAVSVAAVIALARTQRASLEHPWPLPLPRQAFPDRDGSVAPSRARLLMGALGLVCVAAAYHFALLAEGVPALGLVACAALCWRPLIDVRPKTVPLAWLGGLTLLVMAVAAAFRFYKAGAVPQGMICYDEPLCYSIARQIVTGVREIFNSNGSNGQVPFWASALTLRVFGDGILGYRLSCCRA